MVKAQGSLPGHHPTDGARLVAPRDRHHARSDERERQPSDVAAFTLVEMLVSLVILAVILSATAASLISFTRQALDNERRVQATSQLGALQERFQGIPWGWAGVYHDEVKRLDEMIADGDVEGIDGLEFDEDNDVYTYGEEPLSLLPGPDCPEEDWDDCRVGFVPRVFEFDLEVDDRFYDVFQFVTELSLREPDDEPDIRRFHTIVRWEVRGRDFEQVFVSDRAPTTGEVAALNEPPIRQFLVTPTPIDAQAHGSQEIDGEEVPARVQNEEPVRIAARFDRGLVQAQVCVFDREDFLDEEGESTFDPLTFEPTQCDDVPRFTMNGVLLGDGALYSGFEVQIPSAAIEFEDEDFVTGFDSDGLAGVKMVLVGSAGGGEYFVTDTNVLLLDYERYNGSPDMGATVSGIDSADPQPFAVDPTLVDVTQELCEGFEMQVTTAGASMDDTVRLYFSDRDRGLGTSDGQLWNTFFEEGAVSPWLPRPGSPVHDIFYATATSTFDLDDGLTVSRRSRFVSSSEVEFRFSPEPGGLCPS